MTGLTNWISQYRTIFVIASIFVFALGASQVVPDSSFSFEDGNFVLFANVASAIGEWGVCCDSSSGTPPIDGGWTTSSGTSSGQPIVVEPPRCDRFDANPSTIDRGQSSTLTWGTTRADTAEIEGIGAVARDNGSQSVSPNQTTTYKLTVRNSAGSDVCYQTVVVRAQAPSCTLTANPKTINLGGSSTLTWTTTNAHTVYFTDAGTVALNGSKTVSPNRTTEYAVTAVGAGGSVVCRETVIVQQPEPQAPSCTLNANPTAIQHGGSSTLTWSSTNATSASLNQGIGGVSTNGNRTVNPTGTTTYVLTVTGPGGTVNCQVTITVQEQQNAPWCSIWATPQSIMQGGSSKLEWLSGFATSASINQGIGSVTPNVTDFRTVSPSVTTTYVMTVTGPGGTSTCQTTITVQTQHNAPYCTISANPSVVNYGGSTTISWNSQNATSANLSEIGTVSTNGSQFFSNITGTKTYTLTVSGPGGTATCQTTVTVQQQQAPFCTIYANPSYVQYGQTTTVTWTSQNATSAFLSEVGNVNLNGSHTFSNITGNKTITLTVTGPGGTQTCQTTVTVQQANAPYCTLYASPSYVPYNGSTTLTWTSQNATSATLGEVGTVSTNGSRTFSNITANKSYTLTVWNSSGQSNTCTTYVTVQNVPTTNLSCSIWANPNSIGRDGSSTLTWTSTNAAYATLSDGIGSVNTNGSLTVRPESTRSYTLTVRDYAGNTNTCSTVVNVSGSYVALSVIPYTGINAGVAYWLGLVLLTVGAAFVAIRYHANVLASTRDLFVNTWQRRG